MRQFRKTPILATSRRGWWNKYFTCMDLNKFHNDYGGDDYESDYFEDRIYRHFPDSTIICALIPRDNYSSEDYMYLVKFDDETIAPVAPGYDNYLPKVYTFEDFKENYPRW